MTDRLDRIQQLLADIGLDALLVSQAQNRRYISGFTGSAGFLLITAKNAVLAVDSRYTKQAAKQSPAFEIYRTSGAVSSWFAELASSYDNVKKIGFEGGDISFYVYRSLTAGISGKELVATEGIVEALRAVKDEGELALIEKAVKIADAAFESAAASLQPGMTEREAAWQIEKTMRESGSENMPFDVIVASGPNASMPHHRPTERPIAHGETIVIDMGARYGGYTSDLSRTITLGMNDDKFGKIYDLVLGAQLAAIATIKEGMTGDTADRLARTVIEEGGYGEMFGHGLGHGIGLATHESPRLGSGSADMLKNGMVFTIEPGIYIEGWGGVRIEDTVVMQEGKVRVLSSAQKIR